MATKRRTSRTHKSTDPQLAVLKDMFVALLLLHGVKLRSVANTVAVDYNRVRAISKALGPREAKGRHAAKTKGRQR